MHIPGIATIILIVAIVFWYKARETELQVHQELRMREMEHARKMQELQIERAKIEAEKSKRAESG